MKRRDFVKFAGVAGVGSAALGTTGGLGAGWMTSTDELLSALRGGGPADSLQKGADHA